MLASRSFSRCFSGRLGSAALVGALHAVAVALALAAGGGRVVLTAAQQPVQVRLLPPQPPTSQLPPPPLPAAPRPIAPPPVAIPLPELPLLPLSPEPTSTVEAAAPLALAASAAASAAGSDGDTGGEPPHVMAGPVAVERIAYAHFEPPAYPALSRRLGEQGLVLLQVLIDEDGRPVRIDVHRSSGYARLDHAALEAVRRARFRPHREGDRPRAAIALVPVRFEST